MVWRGTFHKSRKGRRMSVTTCFLHWNPHSRKMKRLLVSELWNDFARRVLPKDAPVIQRQEMRRAFYAGCDAFMKAVEKALDPGTQETDADLALMMGVSDELAQFARDVVAGKA